MERRAQRNELSCMWGLLCIIESCQGRTNRKLISNGRPVNKHIIEYPRKLDQLAPRFDQECRRIQNETDLANITADAARNVEDMPFEKHKTKQNMVNGHRHEQIDSKLVDHLVKAHKRAKENRHQTSSSRLQNSSAEISLNELTLARILRAVYAQKHQEESLHTSTVDGMFIDRKLIYKEGGNSESKYSNKDLFSELFPDPNSLFPRRIKNLHLSQTEKETVKSILEREDQYASTSEKGRMNENLLQMSVKASFVAQPSDKIVILKPAPRNATHTENVTCHCSPMQSRKKLSRRASDIKPASFLLREMKKKLKHTFGVTRTEPSRLPMVGTSKQLSHSRSTLKVADESFNSSTNVKTKGKLRNEQDLKSSTGFDAACVTDTLRKKLDLSSVGISNKQEFDVILEAKKQLSARFKTVNAVETVTDEKSVKTLGRILSSPEHDFRPVSPRRDEQHVSDSLQMGFSPYNTSTKVIESSSKISSERERACLSPSRPITEVTSGDDYNKNDPTIQIMDTNTSSLIRSMDEEAHFTDISAKDDMKSNGELKIVEMDSMITRPQLCASEESGGINSNDVTRAMQITDTTESEKDDGTDSLSENEAFSSTVNDSPSTSSSIYRLDTAESNKYQEEHRSPVSVLEPFFTEDTNSPSSVTLQTDGRQFKPLRLDFEESSFESFPHDQPISASSCTQEQNHLSRYVHLIMEASCLDWDHVSEFTSPHEEPIDSYLFYELEFLPSDCCFDPKLLFDHINEVLLEIHHYHFSSPPWLTFVKPKTEHAPLAELVVDEIMTKADFYLLPRTGKRTLDELCSKDVAGCRSWLDVRLDTEQIVIEVSEEFVDEFIVDMLLEFYV